MNGIDSDFMDSNHLIPTWRDSQARYIDKLKGPVILRMAKCTFGISRLAKKLGQIINFYSFRLFNVRQLTRIPAGINCF